MSLNFGYTSPEIPSGTFTGGILSKDLDLNGNSITNLPTPTDDRHPATKKYTDDKLAEKLNLAGGDLTGEIDMGGNKIRNLEKGTSDNDAATKKYVDDKTVERLSIRGGTVYGELSMDREKIINVGTPTNNYDAANKQYVDNKATTLTTSINTKLSKTGGDLTGEIDMGDNKITDLATPTENDDAATKKYVDDKFATSPNEAVYYNFLFGSGSNNAWIQPRGSVGRVFFTGDKDVKITMYAQIFDDDNSVSNLNLYYRIIYWTKTQVKKTTKTFIKTNTNKSIAITGTWLNVFFIDESITLTDVKCFRVEYKYFHTANLGNESSVHCLIEYV